MLVGSEGQKGKSKVSRQMECEKKYLKHFSREAKRNASNNFPKEFQFNFLPSNLLYLYSIFIFQISQIYLRLRK